MAREKEPTDAIPEDIRAMSFEQALAELEEIVRRLEAGDVDLESSIDQYTRGTALKRHCQDKLRAAQEKIDKIIVGGDGKPVGTEPLDIED